MDEFARIPDAADAEPEGDGKRIFRALVVGIDSYDDAGLATTMQFCSQSAALMAEQLEASNYVVRQLHDHPGSDGRPTLAAVKRELAQLMEKADADDTVLFYFGGHGLIEDERPVLLFADAKARRERFVEGALPIAELLTALRGRPRFTVVLLDACHMGLAFDPELVRSTADAADREEGGGFALLSGSTSQDVTQDSTAGAVKGGAFTLGVLAGLSGGAVDHDGGVRFSSLARYVQDHVEKWKRTREARTIDARQRPVLRLEVADVQVIPAPRNHRDLTPPPKRRICHADISADGRSLVTGEEDGAVRVWDLATCTPLHEAISHDGPVVNVTFSASATEVVSVSRAGVSKLWDLATGDVQPTQRVKRRGEVNAVAWSDDGFSRAVATSDGLFTEALHDVVTPEMSRQWGGKHTHFTAVVFVPETSQITSGDVDGNVCFWSLDDDQVPMDTQTIDGPVRALAGCGRFELMAIAGARDGFVWNGDTGKLVPLRGHGGELDAIAMTDDGKLVATACRDGLVRVFESRSGKLRRTLRLGPAGRGEHPEATAVCFSARGDRLFAGYSDGRGRRYKL